MSKQTTESDFVCPHCGSGGVQITIGMPILMELARGNTVELERATLYAADDLPRYLWPMIDHPIARMQVGPDGGVPGNTVEALVAWRQEATRLFDKIVELERRIKLARTEVATTAKEANVRTDKEPFALARCALGLVRISANLRGVDVDD